MPFDSMAIVTAERRRLRTHTYVRSKGRGGSGFRIRHHHSACDQFHKRRCPSASPDRDRRDPSTPHPAQPDPWCATVVLATPHPTPPVAGHGDRRRPLSRSVGITNADHHDRKPIGWARPGVRGGNGWTRPADAGRYGMRRPRRTYDAVHADGAVPRKGAASMRARAPRALLRGADRWPVRPRGRLPRRGC